MSLMDRLKPEDQKKLKAKQAVSREEQKERRWAYSGNYGVLCETAEEYEEIKDIYDQKAPTNKESLVVKKIGQIRKEVRQAKRDLEAKKAEKKVEKKVEKKAEK